MTVRSDALQGTLNLIVLEPLGATGAFVLMRPAASVFHGASPEFRASRTGPVTVLRCG
jgi:hypothetical protein